MATFSTDFSGYAAGDIVTVGGGAWATQGTLTSWTRQVEVDGSAIGGKRLNVQDDSQDFGSQISAVVNDTIGGTAGDIEILIALRITTFANRSTDKPSGGPVLIQTNNLCYGLLFTSTTSVSLGQFGTGWSHDATVAGPATVTAISNSALHWCRLGRSGTSVRFKFWKDGETEPGSWNSGTDTTATTVKAGMGYLDYNAGPFITEWVGIGTGADSAPAPTVPASPVVAWIRA